ncbi:amidase [Cupriavidus basilensis OR16]|uniref:Amidase n=1 Tax=Cupriavidus basilensis OR16 TaxID=1127483 RepID=H1S4F5_9BURK|nr:amidase [Cupriavidus basilensis OR16]
MNDFLALPARELAARMARRELSAQTLVRAYIERIDAAEAGILAWQHFDGAQALQQARLLDAGPVLGALHGLPIGVKDLMDTADMPTTYGSPIYAGHRPGMDAACVAMARAAGAVVMGKTVTTEFATFQPGPTRNPRRARGCPARPTRNPRAPADAPRTPGGSSSGSAAAVAAGMVPIAFGTQTAGSIIRPAAYCGVVGYKPTYGTLPSAGIKSLSPSLDTVGVLARSVDDAAFFIGAMARLSLTPRETGRPMPLRVGICRTPHWERAGDDSRRALDTAARLLEGQGAVLSDLMLPAEFDELTQAQIDIMAYEAAAAFAPETRRGPMVSAVALPRCWRRAAASMAAASLPRRRSPVPRAGPSSRCSSPSTSSLHRARRARPRPAWAQRAIPFSTACGLCSAIPVSMCLPARVRTACRWA